VVFKPEVPDIPIQHAGASLSGISVDDWKSHSFEPTGHTGDQNLVTPAEVRPDGSIYFQEISNISGLENIKWEDMPVYGGIWGMYPPKFDAIEVPIVANIAEARDEHFTAVDEKIGKMLGFFSSGGTNLDPKNGEQKFIDEQEFSMANAEWDKVTDKEDVIAYLRGQSTIRPKSLDTFTRALQAQYLPYEITRAKYEPSI
jgi:hypothetical protein